MKIIIEKWAETGAVSYPQFDMNNCRYVRKVRRTRKHYHLIIEIFKYKKIFNFKI